MRAPAFWRVDGGAAWMLAPLALIYDAVGRCRHAVVRPRSVDIPIICVGNLVAGGAGKTPTALAIGAALQQRGRQPHFLTRGYGGREEGPTLVLSERHTASDVGDEPLLLARQAPTWVAKHRPAGARAAVEAGADMIVMDDGYQNPSMAKDLSFLVVDEGYGFGNGRVHPAGPLRENLERGLQRADALVLIHGDERARVPLPPLPAELPVLSARLMPTAAAQKLTGRRVLAFAGIGRPERFFASVRALGIDIVGTRAFADHHAYRPDEIMQLVEEANAADAIPVTTAKDAVRLPEEARSMVEVIDVNLTFTAPDLLERLLDGIDTGPAVARAQNG